MGTRPDAAATGPGRRPAAAVRAAGARLLRGALGFVAALLLTAGLYGAAALLGALVRGAAEVAPGAGRVTVHVLSNGYHTDIALPRRAAGRDLTSLLLASPILAEGAAETEWLVVGWGSRTAYTRVGDILDLTPGIALRALAFDRSVMHVLPARGLAAGPDARPVELSEDGYRRLVDGVLAGFARSPSGALRPLPGVTQGYGDAFFEARGRFSPFQACNTWTGTRLREAGVRVGLWTPFARSVMASLPE